MGHYTITLKTVLNADRIDDNKLGRFFLGTKQTQQYKLFQLEQQHICHGRTGDFQLLALFRSMYQVFL